MRTQVSTSTSIFSFNFNFNFNFNSIQRTQKKSDSVELQDKFYYWLQHVGINSNRSTIVEVVAKKVNMWIPGIYDENAYSSENK